MPDPLDGTPAPLFHPQWHHWRDHFEWTDDFTRVAGLTLTGRATVEAPQLNRPGLVNLRALLVADDQHPAPSRRMRSSVGCPGGCQVHDDYGRLVRCMSMPGVRRASGLTPLPS